MKLYIGFEDIPKDVFEIIYDLRPDYNNEFPVLILTTGGEMGAVLVYYGDEVEEFLSQIKSKKPKKPEYSLN